MFNYTNKKIIITGGCSGIGLATALDFFKQGARIAIIDNNIDNINHVKKKYPNYFYIAQADVGNYEQFTAVFSTCLTHLGDIDVLIANAGISVRNKFLDITPQQWHKVMRTNLDGIFYACQLAAKHMLKKKMGTILITASTNALKAHPFYADYNASKAALIALTKTIAVELAPYIRVNAIAPGYVLTEMQLNEYTDEMLEKVNDALPLKRHATPEEIAHLFSYLASDVASYITGQVITIDGGETA